MRKVSFFLEVKTSTVYYFCSSTARLCSNFWIVHNLGSTIQVAFSYVGLKKPPTTSTPIQDGVETCES
ncbi:unnamed protein product [Ixodes pacificus]